MVLNQYEEDLWCENFRVSRQTFRYICELVGRHLVRHDANMRRAIPVQKQVGVALWRLVTGNSYRTTGLVFGVGRCTALKLKDEFGSALLRVSSDFIKFPKDRLKRDVQLKHFKSSVLFPMLLAQLMDRTSQSLRQMRMLTIITTGSSSTA